MTPSACRAPHTPHVAHNPNNTSQCAVIGTPPWQNREGKAAAPEVTSCCRHHSSGSGVVHPFYGRVRARACAYV
jgi:hypothetical protein